MLSRDTNVGFFAFYSTSPNKAPRCIKWFQSASSTSPSILYARTSNEWSTCPSPTIRLRLVSSSLTIAHYELNFASLAVLPKYTSSKATCFKFRHRPGCAGAICSTLASGHRQSYAVITTMDQSSLRELRMINNKNIHIATWHDHVSENSPPKRAQTLQEPLDRSRQISLQTCCSSSLSM